ncbi:MAG: hypothetical protein ACM31E_06460 [Fibrobacterota bacterium]|nr:hypothetical protein [Chitinispirillaceae bacterium]
MSHLVSSEVNQMSFPSVQPLRYWKSRPVEAVIVREHNKRLSITASKGFAMKGGFVHAENGARRLIIAGRIFKNDMVVA